MRRLLALVIVGLFAVTALFAAAPVSASGSIEGTFPDRVITLSRTSQKDTSYTIDIPVTGPGSWWVELQSLDGSWVLAQIYDSPTVKGKPVSSTDLREVGDVSKPKYIPEGSTYVMRLTYFGKMGSAILAEHFVEKPIPELTEHERIQIWGDNAFTAENGVIAGTGAEGNPYIIAGWIIDAEDYYWALEVAETSKHFVISNCLVYGGGEPFGGVSLFKAVNGIVEDVVAHDNQMGIGVTLSQDIVVRDCLSYSNSAYGICVAESSCVVLESNTLQGQYVGVWIGGWTGPKDDLVKDNSIANCEMGIYIDRMTTSTFSGNTITGCNAAITLGQSSKCVVSDNVVSMSNTGYGAIHLRYDTDCVVEGNVVQNTLGGGNGIYVVECQRVAISGNRLSVNTCGMLIVSYGGTSSDIVVTGNVFTQNGVGLEIVRSDNVVVYGNDFLQNTYSQAYQYESGIAWDQAGRGNYWSDYIGSDSNNDGIGDTPYVARYDVVDNYPLMEPCVIV